MNKKLLFYLFGIILFAGISFFLLQKNKNTVQVLQTKKLSIVTSFYPVYFFTKEIAGDKAEVLTITPPGIEPHEYEPTAQDIAKIQNSQLLILNGAGFEPWYEKLEKDLQQKNITVVDATKAMTLMEGEHEEEHAGEEAHEDEEIKDPHVWLDPTLAKQQAVSIGTALEKTDPENAAYYQENTRKLIVQFDQLHTDFRSGLHSCQKKDFVTSHKAFAYLAKQYGLIQIPISGLSPDEEPSAQQLAEVADFVKKNNIEIIFFETLISPKLSETIAHETGAMTMVLDPIEGISDDNKGADYFSVMRNNLAALQTALQCNK